MFEQGSLPTKAHNFFSDNFVALLCRVMSLSAVAHMAMLLRGGLFFAPPTGPPITRMVSCTCRKHLRESSLVNNDAPFKFSPIYV